VPFVCGEKPAKTFLTSSSLLRRKRKQVLMMLRCAFEYRKYMNCDWGNCIYDKSSILMKNWIDESRF